MGFSRESHVYGLREVGGQVRYIGLTEFGIQHRLKEHIGTALRGTDDHRPVYPWIRDCLSRGVQIEVVHLATVLPSQDIGPWLTGFAVESCLIESADRFFAVNRRERLLNATAEAHQIALGFPVSEGAAR